MTVEERAGRTHPSATATCPVCGSASRPGEQIPDWGGWRECVECTLKFADPLGREHDAVPWFSEAYRGGIEYNGMTDFRNRVQQRRVILDELDAPELWFWTPAFAEVISWLKAELKPGATVLDVGCGLGFFLHALRKEGFNAVGLDVAEPAVELTRADGFEVWHGPIETMPHNWQNPDAVVSFFMIHHLEDPRAFIAALRERAPDAPLAIAAYGPTNVGEIASLPPRTLIRWNSRALSTVLELGGYAADVQDIRSTGTEIRPIMLIRKALARSATYPRLYKLGKVVESRLLALVPKDARADAFVLLALARPSEGREATA
jgi:SAM-dependent methyltransferase